LFFENPDNATKINGLFDLPFGAVDPEIIAFFGREWRDRDGLFVFTEL
jgi:hypothetical protein